MVFLIFWLIGRIGAIRTAYEDFIFPGGDVAAILPMSAILQCYAWSGPAHEGRPEPLRGR